MAGTDINTVVENSIRSCLSKIGVNPDWCDMRKYASTLGLNFSPDYLRRLGFDLGPRNVCAVENVEKNIAEIVYDPDAKLERNKDLAFTKVRRAILEKDYQAAVAHMNEGIDSKIISCNDENSDWYQLISSLYDCCQFSILEPFMKDFIGRIERKEISTKIPLSGCYEILANTLLANKKKEEAVAAIEKASKVTDNPELIEYYVGLRDFIRSL